MRHYVEGAFIDEGRDLSEGSYERVECLVPGGDCSVVGESLRHFVILIASCRSSGNSNRTSVSLHCELFTGYNVNILFVLFHLFSVLNIRLLDHVIGAAYPI